MTLLRLGSALAPATSWPPPVAAGINEASSELAKVAFSPKWVFICSSSTAEAYIFIQAWFLTSIELLLELSSWYAKQGASSYYGYLLLSSLCATLGRGRPSTLGRPSGAALGDQLLLPEPQSMLSWPCAERPLSQ